MIRLTLTLAFLLSSQLAMANICYTHRGEFRCRSHYNSRAIVGYCEALVSLRNDGIDYDVTISGVHNIPLMQGMRTSGPQYEQTAAIARSAARYKALDEMRKYNKCPF